jgi:hypothetical protein
MKKRIFAVIIAVCIFVLPLTVISFAGDNELKNDAFYIEPSGEYDIWAFVDDEITFELERTVDEFDEEAPYEYVYISLMENTGVDNVEEDKAELDKFFNYIVDEYLFLFDENIFKSEVSEINGYKCIKYFGVDDDTYYYTGYVLATEENLYCLLTETDVKGSAFIESSVNSFTINGTLLAGDSHKNTVDFTDAENYKDQAAEIAGDFGLGGVMDEDVNSYARIGIIVLLIPFVVVLILAIVFIVKYSKNRKILEQYEKTFGGMGMGMPPFMINNQINIGATYNNDYMPGQPMNQNGQQPFNNDGQNNMF